MTHSTIRIYLENISTSKKVLMGEFHKDYTSDLCWLQIIKQCDKIDAQLNVYHYPEEDAIYRISVEGYMDSTCIVSGATHKKHNAKHLIDTGLEDYVTTEEGRQIIKSIKSRLMIRKIISIITAPFRWLYKKIRSHIPFLIFVGLWCWGAMSIKNCANDHAKKEEQKEIRQREIMSSRNLNIDAPGALLDHGVAVDGVTDEGYDEIPQWCGELGGDTAKVRKIFLKSMRELYGDSKGNRDPGHISFEIKGNNLYMYSYQFKEESASWAAQIEFYQYFQDCDFDTVFAYQGNYGGAHGWNVYYRGDEKNSFGDTSDMPRLRKFRWWEVFTDLFDRHVEKEHREYSKKLDEWSKRKQKQYEDEANAYRAKFIAHKDSLYNQRKNK